MKEGNENEILPTGYSLYCMDRGTRGGDVLLAVKNTIPSYIMSSWSLPDLEALYVNIGSNNPSTVCIVDNPPSSTEEHLLTFNYLHNVSDLCNNKLILIGDFNFPKINWSLLQGDTWLTYSMT